jgi:hypothetical protein
MNILWTIISQQVNYIAEVLLIFPIFLGILLVFYHHGKAFFFLALQGQERFVNFVLHFSFFVFFSTFKCFHDIPFNSPS